MAENESTLFKTKFKREVVISFCKQLKDFGNMTMHYFEVPSSAFSSRPQRNMCRNYLICAILKHEEIINKNFEVINAAKEKLQSTKKENYRNFLLLSRVVVVKHHWFRDHAEERVFDPYREIGKNVQAGVKTQPEIQSLGDKKRVKIDILQKLTEGMTDQPYVICMYSYYIPCTTPDHMCSKIISEFATKYNEKVIVSYDDVFPTTSQEMAIEIMNSNRNIITMSLEKPVVIPGVSGRKYGKSKRQKFGCLYLDGSGRKAEKKKNNKK